MTRDHQAEHRARAADLGLRQTGIRSCPRTLAGRQHRPGCWCEHRLNDHGRRYMTTRDGTPVVMWEPYDAAGHELAEVIEAASVDGFTVTVTGASPWNSGATFALTFEAARSAGCDPRSADQPQAAPRTEPATPPLAGTGCQAGTDSDPESPE